MEKVNTNPGCFKKGQSGYWKGKRFSKEHIENLRKARIVSLETRLKMSEAMKGRKITWSDKISLAQKGKPRPDHLGEKNVNWKGDDVSYRSLHKWVQSKLDVPHFCKICKRKDLKHRQYNWSNISKKYKRDLSDWQRLCVKCHKEFDKK